MWLYALGFQLQIQKIALHLYVIVDSSSFHLNGHTLGFHPQIQKLGPPCAALHNKQHHRKVLLSSSHLNGQS